MEPTTPLRIVAGGPPEQFSLRPDRVDSLLRTIAVENGPMLPPERHVGPCRVCGKTETLTEEHLPPRGAFNKGTTRAFSLDMLLGRESLEPIDWNEGDRPVQGGISAFTLCETCNNLTGTRWGREYQEWARRFGALIAITYERHGDLDEMSGYPTATGVEFRHVYPGRFIRQVLSMFLSISGGPELGREYPDLVELVLGGAPRALPAPLRIYLHGYAGGQIRIAGGAGASVLDLETDDVRRLMAFDFPPMGLVMLLEGPPLDAGIDISDFAELGVDEMRTLTADVPLGFGHKPFPADYRTKAQMLADRGATPDE